MAENGDGNSTVVPRPVIADIRRLYADALAFALALPVLFSIPALIEFAQHIVEIDIGLYRDGVAVLGTDQRRLTLGFAKTLALLLPGYWFVRYMAWERDATKAKQIEQPAAMLFGVQFSLRALVQWLTLFGPPLGVVLGLGRQGAQYASLVTGMTMSVVVVYLTACFVAWPLGNRAIGPVRSIAVMSGGFWRAVGYLLAGTLPLMIVHYALGYGAIGRPDWLVWTMMAIDALVVGLLALTMNGALFLGAVRAAERNGVQLATIG